MLEEHSRIPFVDSMKKWMVRTSKGCCVSTRTWCFGLFLSGVVSGDARLLGRAGDVGLSERVLRSVRHVLWPLQHAVLDLLQRRIHRQSINQSATKTDIVVRLF
jgi:hypothetical protein